MAQIVYVYGKSGAGKSRSLKNFAEDEILLIKCMDKELPFRSKFKYTGKTVNVDAILGQLKKMSELNIKTAVIDDAGYIMTNIFMEKHGKGDQYAVFNLIADSMWKLINGIKALPADIVVYLIFHEEKTEIGETKLLTIGKLLDGKVCLEGMVSVVIHCVAEEKKHYFITQGDGMGITKSPEEMFKEAKMENDLKAVDKSVREYYGISLEKKEEN